MSGGTQALCPRQARNSIEDCYPPRISTRKKEGRGEPKMRGKLWPAAGTAAILGIDLSANSIMRDRERREENVRMPIEEAKNIKPEGL
jgi:hypothetical protein